MLAKEQYCDQPLSLSAVIRLHKGGTIGKRVSNDGEGEAVGTTSGALLASSVSRTLVTCDTT